MIYFSQRLKQYQREHNLTQMQLSSMTGVSQTTLSTYIRGAKVPTLDTLDKIATALGVSIGWLCGEDTPDRMNLTTYADVIRVFLSLSEKDFEMDDPVRFKTQDINLILDGGLYEGNIAARSEGVRIDIPDETLAKFVTGWNKIKAMRDEGYADDDIYQTWIKGKLAEHENKPIATTFEMVQHEPLTDEPCNGVIPTQTNCYRLEYIDKGED